MVSTNLLLYSFISMLFLKRAVESLNSYVIALCNVIRQIFSTNYNDEFYHVVSCYLEEEDGIAIF